MRIIQSCGSKAWGGLEMQTLKISRALRDRGHEVWLLCRPNSPLEARAAESDLTVRALLGHKAAAAVKLRALLKSGDFAVIHTHLSNDLGALVPGIRLAGWPGRLFLTKRMGSSIRKTDPVHRLLYARVDGIFAISNYIRQNVLESCPVAPEKVRLMWNALDISLYNPDVYDRWEVRRELQIEPHEVVVGMIGRITPKKGHLEFLEAARLIKKNAGRQHVIFLIVGTASAGEEAYAAEVQRRAAGEFELGNDIIWAGYREDIARVLTAMDILVFPSHREAFGTTLLEAMCMCVPVVASNSGGVPDIVVNRRTGLLVPPRDPEALAEGVLKLVQNPEMRKHLGISGRIRVEEKFDFRHYIEQLEKYYQNGI